jgi:hypothetical protein
MSTFTEQQENGIHEKYWLTSRRIESPIRDEKQSSLSSNTTHSKPHAGYTEKQNRPERHPVMVSIKQRKIINQIRLYKKNNRKLRLKPHPWPKIFCRRRNYPCE